jgi:murein L,D-transpeptidase YcbB/YkuD
MLSASLHKRFLIAFIVFWSNGFLAQPVTSTQSTSHAIAERLRNRIEAARALPQLAVGEEQVYASKALPDFYEQRGYRPAWSTETGVSPYANRLVIAIRGADREGLRPADYHIDRIEALLEQVREAAVKEVEPASGLLVDLDLLLTDAFMIYGSHLLAGRVNPETIDPEWVANRRNVDMVLVLGRALDSGKIEEELNQLLPPQPGYLRLKTALAAYRRIQEEGGWSSIPEGHKLQMADRDPRVRALRARLTGIAEPGASVDNHSDLFDETLEQMVIGFQSRHGLDADGVVGLITLAALNVGVSDRIDQIEMNMERWRWLPQQLGSRYVIVNIADFMLDVVEEGQTVLSMRAVVGRNYRRTPVFSDKMTYIVLSPYWNVPPGIGANDIIPAVKRDPGYLVSKNIRVFHGWGSEAKEIDSRSIDWSKVSTKTPDYRFRQDPGPANSLGRIKFMFPNKFNVYLHDTPATELFDKVDRTFSSGCIRIEKPIELAEYVLNDGSMWTRDAIMAQILRWRERTVTLREPIPVHLLYWTAWVTEDGTVHFRKDIYGRDARLENALDKSAPRL